MNAIKITVEGRSSHCAWLPNTYCMWTGYFGDIPTLEKLEEAVRDDDLGVDVTASVLDKLRRAIPTIVEQWSAQWSHLRIDAVTCVKILIR